VRDGGQDGAGIFDRAGRQPLARVDAPELVGYWPLHGQVDRATGEAELQPEGQGQPSPVPGPFFDEVDGALRFDGASLRTELAPLRLDEGGIQLEVWARMEPVDVRSGREHILLRWGALVRVEPVERQRTELQLQLDGSEQGGKVLPRCVLRTAVDLLDARAADDFPAEQWRHLTCQLSRKGDALVLTLLADGLPAGEDQRREVDLLAVVELGLISGSSRTELRIGSLGLDDRFGNGESFRGELAGLAVKSRSELWHAIARRTQPGPARLRVLVDARQSSCPANGVLVPCFTYSQLRLFFAGDSPGSAQDQRGLLHPERGDLLFWRADEYERPFSDLTFTGRLPAPWSDAAAAINQPLPHGPAPQGRGTIFAQEAVKLTATRELQQGEHLTVQLRSTGRGQGDLLAWGPVPQAAGQQQALRGLALRADDEALRLFTGDGARAAQAVERPLDGPWNEGSRVIVASVKGGGAPRACLAQNDEVWSCAEPLSYVLPASEQPLLLGEGVWGPESRWAGSVDLLRLTDRENEPPERRLPARPIQLTAGALYAVRR